MIKSSVFASVTSAFASMGITGWFPPMALFTFSPFAWYIDSGPSNDMTSIAQNLHSMVPYTRHEQIVAAIGQNLPISGIGSIEITTPKKQSLFSIPHLFRSKSFS